MAVRKILLHTNPILRQKTKPVEKIDKDVLDLVSDLIDTMYAEQGYGVAANQVGVSIQLFVLDTTWADGGPKNPRIFLNPIILFQDEATKFEEGCLSIPGGFIENTRFNRLKLRYMTLEGTTVEEEFTGLTAIAIQHEMDHLNGKLFIDDLSPLKRAMVLKRSQKRMRLR